MTPRVRVGMPCYGRLAPEVVFSLLGLCGASASVLATAPVGGAGDGVEGAPYFHFRNYCFVDDARNAIVHEVLLDPDCTHLLWLDWDHLWPARSLHRLLSHGLDVVGAVYFMRTPPHDIPHGRFTADGRVRRLQQIPTGLAQVDVLGLGCALVRTDVLRRMRDHYGDEQWFRKDGEAGEDVWFGRRLCEMMVLAYADGGLIVDHVLEMRLGRAAWEAIHT